MKSKHRRIHRFRFPIMPSASQRIFEKARAKLLSAGMLMIAGDHWTLEVDKQLADVCRLLRRSAELRHQERRVIVAARPVAISPERKPKTAD